MMKFKRKDQKRSLAYGLLAVLLLVVSVSAGWFLVVKFEGEPPGIELDMEDPYVSAEARIRGVITDAKSGIQKLWISVMQQGRETVLAEETFEKGVQAAPVRQRAFSVKINAAELGLEDGEAVLRIAAWDDSWRNWFSGNRAYAEKKIIIDTIAPQPQVLTRQHNISRGGAGLIVYRLTEKCPKHGVFVGDRFFPGHKGYFDDPQVFLALFALTHDQGPDTELYLGAVDRAGNKGQSGFYHYIRNKNFKSETLRVSDAFLKRILPEFQNTPGLPRDAAPVEQFLFINRDLRQKNNQAIVSLGRKTDPDMYWSGDFGRLPNSARKAGYADHRAYVYNGEVIDREVHLGIDLASVRQAPVPAANAGRVAFVGWVGIYGNVVAIDHGFGLFSVYAHLSRTGVNEGQMVEKDEIIGHTGSTGLAVGDHLHFAMLVHDVFVNPVEWWDASWIQNNVTVKLRQVRSLLNKEQTG